MFTKPQDREVVCNASAWDIDLAEDLRIKMCIHQTDEDFTTIHHELGHNFYQRAYDTQPVIFRDSAIDGFHEAIGDTIALSVTPEYLMKIKLLDRAPDASRDLGLLMKKALEKVAFLPFGLMIDQWRWKVFSGEVGLAGYNSAWWQLRLKYQDRAVGPRGEEFFDRREVSRAGEHAVRALFPRGHPPVPVSPRAVEDCQLHAAAEPLLDLREPEAGRRLARC
jgi:peptidyl-dipeptidase A